MHRFFISPDCIDSESVVLPPEVSRQLTRVLRARPGEKIVVLDNSGQEYLITIDDLVRDAVRGTILEKSFGKGEPRIKITLYQGILKSDRFEYVLQKGTEVGISTFVPVYCERSIARANRDGWSENRVNRWRRIISEAAEQSRRFLLPVLEPSVDFHAACDAFEGEGLIPWEEERSTGLKSALSSLSRDDAGNSSISVFIGPEGGFSTDEIERAVSRGIVPVSLGNRILRAETAGLVAAAAILYELDELG